MWPMNPDYACFQAAKSAAANVLQAGERGGYSAELFLNDFPQFSQAAAEEEGKSAISLVPEAMLQMFIEQANDSVLPSRWGSMWRYAAGLYTAHFSAMYLQAYSPGCADAAQTAAKARQAGAVKSATMGDTTVSYDNSAITSGTEKWGSWNATQYGQQLVTLARLVGMGGMYVI